jgi:hypothetical protein
VSTARTTTVTVTRGGERMAHGAVDVPPGGRETVDSGIDRPGAYAFHVDVADGPDLSRTLSIEDYDLRTGANVVVTLGDVVEILIEE